MKFRKVVAQGFTALLDRLAETASAAREEQGEKQVHELRVATRRLSQNLRTFASFLPEGKGAKVRKRLRKMRDVAGEIRSRDIALAQMSAAKVPETSELAEKMRQDRARACEGLSAELARWEQKRYPKRWQRSLGLNDA